MWPQSNIQSDSFLRRCYNNIRRRLYRPLWTQADIDRIEQQAEDIMSKMRQNRRRG